MAGATPVLAAGGIADGRGLAAVLAMGAQGAVMGTRFLASEEMGVAPEWKAAIVAAQARDAVKVAGHERVLPPFNRPHAPTTPRALRTPLVDALREAPETVDPQEVGPVIVASVRAGGGHEHLPFAGQSCGLVHDVLPAAEIVRRTLAGGRGRPRALRGLTDDELDGHPLVAGGAARDEVEQQLPGAQPLAHQGLADRRQPGGRGLGDVVEPRDGDPAAEPRGRAEGAQRELVRRAQQRVGRRRALQQAPRGRLARGLVVVALDDRDLRPVDPRRAQRVLEAGEPVALDREGHRREPLRGHLALEAVGPQPRGEDADARMAPRRDVPGGHPRAAAVVDPEERDPGHPRLVDDQGRQPALEHGHDGGVAVGHGVDAEPVDHGLGDPVARLAAGRRGHEQQGGPGALTRAGEPAEEAGRARVGERVGERLGEQEPDHAAAPRAQPPCGGVRPRVAELARRGEDPLAQLGRELVGPVVGVRDRRARDVQRVGDRLQRHAAAHAASVAPRSSSTSSTARTVVPRSMSSSRAVVRAGRSSAGLLVEPEHVVAHDLPGVVGAALLDRGEDRRVLLRQEREGGRRVRQRHQGVEQVGGDRVAHREHHQQQRLVARRLGERDVELHVGALEGGDVVTGRAHRLQLPPRGAEVRTRAPAGGGLDRGGLERAAQVDEVGERHPAQAQQVAEGLAHGPDRQRLGLRDAQGGVGPGGDDEALGLQRPQGLADRGARDAEAFAELALRGEHRTGRERSVEHRLPQLLGDLLIDGPSHDPLEGHAPEPYRRPA